MPGIFRAGQVNYIMLGSMEGLYGCHLTTQAMRYDMYHDTSAAA